MQLIKVKLMVVALALLAVAASNGSPLFYNQVRWKSSHNSYAKDAGIKKQLGEYRFRSIEFDLHAKKDLLGIKRAPAGDWFVFHELIDRKTNCELLSQCLAEIAEFHRQNPRHHVITVFFDIKDGLHEKSGHSGADLYRALKEGLPEDSIEAPADLMHDCPGAANLQEAVTGDGCHWPALSALRGRFILVVASGRNKLTRAGYDPHRHPVFLVSTDLAPGGISRNPDRVFFNMRGPKPFGQELKKAGFVARAYGLDSKDDFEKAKDLGFHHLAMDHVNPALHPWAETDGKNGEPYEKIK
ncbi:MAG: Ca2+-dependent phosphoinositide-specific phospholipase C [bacterium]